MAAKFNVPSVSIHAWYAESGARPVARHGQ